MNAQLCGDIVKLLEIKKELLVRILDAVKQAAESLREDDMDTFSSEMESCKELMETAEEMSATVDKLKQQMPEESQNTELASLESGILYILGQIEQARRECNDIAEQNLKIYGQQIKAIRHTRKGLAGYASQMKRRHAFFIDEKK